jgi:hypothetical protein
LIDPAWLRPYHSMPPRRRRRDERQPGNPGRATTVHIGRWRTRPPTTRFPACTSCAARSRRQGQAPLRGSTYGRALDTDPSLAIVCTEPGTRTHRSQIPRQEGLTGPAPFRDEPQIPAHRDDDHLRREPEPGERRLRRLARARTVPRLHCPSLSRSCQRSTQRSPLRCCTSLLYRRDTGRQRFRRTRAHSHSRRPRLPAYCRAGRMRFLDRRLDLSALRLATFQPTGKHAVAIIRATKLLYGRRR